MKPKHLICLIGLLLAGCVNTPDTISIQSTVDAAVSTALAPYEERYSEFVTQNDLDASQTEQNQKMQQYILDQIERAKDDITVEENPTPEIIQNSQDESLPDEQTESSVKYDNTNCINQFEYVSDMTIPDWMTITPNTNFKKSWYVTNTGTCVWNSNYKIVYYSGDLVGKSKSFSILNPGYYIKPGESAVVSADLVAPNRTAASFSTFWVMESDKGEQFGGGENRNVYLSSNFRVANEFSLAQNFGSMTCSDDYGYFTCGTSAGGDRGVVYYDDTPMMESHRQGGSAAIVAGPPHVENGTVRFEFGPLRFPRRSWFYTNFCCRPETPTCDVQIRLYVRETGYSERLVDEIREWNDGFTGEWKFRLDDKEIFDQDFTYIIEVQANGGSDSEDLIMFTNTRIY